MNAPAYRLDGRPIPEAAFYAAACDPRRSVVVEACAGAGKTWMLVSRVLRALLDGAEPQSILAITFTRKAAGEMRERLDEWLAAFTTVASTHDQRVQALGARGLDGAQAEALAPALGLLHARLLRSGRAVEVRTFHGWFTQLLAHAPIEVMEALGLPLQYEPIEEPFVLRDALMRRFHAVVDADANLRADYFALVGRHRRATVLQWLESAWRRAPELARADAAGTAEGSVPPAAALWPECASLGSPTALLRQSPLMNDIAALARELGAAPQIKRQAAGRGLVDALQAARAAPVDSARGAPPSSMAAGAQAASHVALGTAHEAAHDAAPDTVHETAHDAACDAAFDAAWAALFTDTDQPRKQLGDSALLAAVQASLVRVAAMRRQQQAHEDHASMLRLSRVLLAEYAALKRRRGLVDMADLERAAEAMLGDSALAGWVQERLDQRLRHVLIDEFQDTSPLQWQVLQSWLSSYAGAGGGGSGQRPMSVFIVGDPKQSIYRFRGAEPRVFAAARCFVAEGLQGQLLECDHTRRNAPAIVTALNAVFDAASQGGAWGPWRAHTTGVTAAGQVLRLPGVARVPRDAPAASEGWRDSLTQPRREPELQRRAEEALQVAAAVHALLHEHGLAPGDVMVLARKRSVLAHVANALAAAGLPHGVAEPLALHESPEALDLVAVLDVLVSPGHDLSLARALKSPLLGADDADLLWLAQRAASRQPWLRVLLAFEQPPTPALQRARQLLAGWAAAAPGLSPHDLLDRIVHEGDAVARLAAAVPPARRWLAQQAVDALLAAALGHRGARLLSVYDFVRDLRAGRVPAVAATPPDAVRLLTVHGAKGLEARAVIVVDSDPEPRQPARATLLVDWPVDWPAPRRVAFLRSESQVPTALAELAAVESAQAQREELNGLYVAMSRAREWLVFSRTEPRPRVAEPSWWARCEPAAAPWQPEAAEGRGPEALTATVAVPALPALHWQPDPQPRATVHDAAAARLGQAVHRVLEWIGQPGRPLAESEWPAAATAAATAFGVAPADAPRVLTVVQHILHSPQAARFFVDPGLRWAGNEVPVSDGGELLRIDRLVWLDSGDGAGAWWVIDFKLAAGVATLSGYRSQLGRYMAAVQALQPADAVRGAIVTGDGTVLSIP